MPSAAKLRVRVASLFSENLPFKVLSLVLAVSIWAWVQADEVVEARTRVQVNYSWPDGLVRTRQVPKTLVVTVSGPQGVVRAIDRSELVVDVDLTDAEQGTVPVDFTELELTGLPAGVEVVQVSPPAIDIELDRALTREVEIRPTVIGEPRDGWLSGGVEVTPATVHITGPQERVKDIVQVATDVIDISNSRGDVVVEVGLAITDRVVGIAPGAPHTVEVTVSIEPVIAERTFDDIPVVVRSPDAWSVQPATARVVLSGGQADVSAIGLDKIAVVLDPPEGTSANGDVFLTWRKDQPDGPVTVAHDGPATGIEVLRVDPRRFTLEARQ